MTKTLSEDLAVSAAELGFKPAQNDPNTTLAEVVKSREERFWAAFPIMLANAAWGGRFSLKATEAQLDEAGRKHLRLLILASLGLYDSLGLKFEWRKTLLGSLPARLAAGFRDRFAQDADLELGALTIPAGRFRENFRLCFGASPAAGRSGLQYSLSQVFTPRQAELFFKKLRREKLTKTETEYFSRVVRKKARALADEELHRLAIKALE